MRWFAYLTSASSVAAVLAFAPLASADTVTALSAPNGDLRATSSSGSLTNKDKDGDFNTLTQADRLSLFYAVSNRTASEQTVRVTVALDGPGTERDMTLLDEDVPLPGADPAQGAGLTQGSFDFQVKHKSWPEGTYSLSVTGSGSETVTATSTFTIAY